MLQAHHEKKELKKKEKAVRREKREQMRRNRKLMQKEMGDGQEDMALSLKIASEEHKLLMAQRRLESIRLLDELFDRIKVSIFSFISYETFL